MKTIRINGKDCQLYWVSGNVLESDKKMQTETSGGQIYYANNRPYSTGISTTTTIHDEIFISDNAGKEHSFQLRNFNVACRTGNKVSVIWAVKGRKRSGPYVAVLNHSTSKIFYHEASLKKICQPFEKIYHAYCISIVLICIAILYFQNNGIGLMWVMSLTQYAILLFVILVLINRQIIKMAIQKFKDNINPSELN